MKIAIILPLVFALGAPPVACIEQQIPNQTNSVQGALEEVAANQGITAEDAAGAIVTCSVVFDEMQNYPESQWGISHKKLEEISDDFYKAAIVVGGVNAALAARENNVAFGLGKDTLGAFLEPCQGLLPIVARALGWTA